MYHGYFGLKEAPFSIAVNPRYLFMSDRHRDALAHLLFGVGAGGGFILLTGEVGTGKTTVNRCLLEQLPDNTDIALILNPALNAIELLATVCDELGIDYQQGEQSLKVLTDKLHQFLLANHARGRNTVLLIDEAQHLKFEVLEQIRLLTNLETNTKKLLQIILVGQPELRTLLNKPELRQLAQRITARYQLKPLNLEETQAYIRHRLQIAGLAAGQQLFPKKVVVGIHKVSRGVPRIINVLCDRMLLGCYGQNKTMVDMAMLKQAVTEVMGEEDDIILDSSRSLLPVGIAVAALLFIALLAWQWPLIQQPFVSPTPGSVAAPVATNTAAPTETMSATLTAADTNPLVDERARAAVPTKIMLPLDSPTVDAIAVEAAPPPATEPIPPPQRWSYDNQQVWLDLLSTIKLPGSIDITSIANPCGPPLAAVTVNDDQLLRCEKLTASSWNALKDYNRPAILTLITPSKLQVYTTLVAIDGLTATVQVNGQTSSISLEELGAIWTGEFQFVWLTTTDYIAPFSVAYSGPLVKWLAQQFASLDGQSKLLAEQFFNNALFQRVKIFQTNNQLEADGVVGVKTLLKLSEQLGEAVTLDATTQAVATETLPVESLPAETLPTKTNPAQQTSLDLGGDS